jgi:flagellar biosynthetic protein FliO
LAIVLAIVAGLFWLLRRLVPSMRSAESGVVRVVGRTSLTPKHHVAVIQLGGKYLAIGMSGERMTKLCEIDDPVEVAELSARSDKQATRGSGSFGDLLFREAAEYRETPNDFDQTPIPTAPSVSAERRPVRDLLHRLKTLTSK